jgi:hypothetical protein
MMASHAWVEDVKLALAGSRVCWSSHVLEAMVDLQLLQPDWRWQNYVCPFVCYVSLRNCALAGL